MNGKKVRPKVIASTATIKNADVQVRGLFLRTVNASPAGARRVGQLLLGPAEALEEEFGRLYLGICAPRTSPEGGPDPGLRRLSARPRPSTRSTAGRSIPG
ncbi:MAG: hypothetical protein WKF75_04575 [Singulisphaera sp.]